ncbi:MAG: radical SAM family heme chaperone HemW [Clostridia bacterium]|jgi:oxygen-independent coproporphyrinogen-3 oxidase
MKSLGLYIHIPFCERKCRYCDFISFAGRERDIGPYVNALLMEMRTWKERLRGYQIDTIFIGGGTPTFLHERDIEQILLECFRLFHIAEQAEISLEANPGTLSLRKLEVYKRAGVNRLSLGLQAVESWHLARLGRIHSFEDFLVSYRLAHEKGFDNINIDLMFGLPDQTLEEWTETLDRVTELEPAHLSCYGLIIEEGTPFYEEYRNGKLRLPREDDEREMYWKAVEELTKQGFEHYEISNFARSGYQCRHNLNYWENGEYIGLGCAAHSFFHAERIANETDLCSYINKIRERGNAVVTRQKIDRTDEMFETVMLGLRLTKGLDLEAFQRRFHISFLEYYREELEKLQRMNLIQIKDRYISLTSMGMDVQNQVLVSFLKED